MMTKGDYLIVAGILREARKIEAADARPAVNFIEARFIDEAKKQNAKFDEKRFRAEVRR